jgi:hypothetical protein
MGLRLVIWLRLVIGLRLVMWELYRGMRLVWELVWCRERVLDLVSILAPEVVLGIISSE